LRLQGPVTWLTLDSRMTFLRIVIPLYYFV
jgi:hypothetical protein